MSGITEQFFREVELGRQGKNLGISTGLSKYDSMTGGIKKTTYSVLFAQMGVAKSTFTIYAYIYKPLLEHLDSGKLFINFYSLEMPVAEVMAKLVSMYLYDTQRIAIGVLDMLSKTSRGVLSDFGYQKINECREWLEKVEKALNIQDTSMSYEDFKRRTFQALNERGDFSGEGDNMRYTPHNSEAIQLFIIDHLGKVRCDKGRSKKQEIDLVSDCIIQFRNMTGASFVAIMQSNRGGMAVSRVKMGYNEPRVEDIKDSNNPAEDANEVLALYDPQRDKLSTYRGFDVAAYRGGLRSICFLKGRNMQANSVIVMNFWGKTGHFDELDSEETYKPEVEFNQQERELPKQQEKKEEVEFSFE